MGLGMTSRGGVKREEKRRGEREGKYKEKRKKEGKGKRRERRMVTWMIFSQFLVIFFCNPHRGFIDFLLSSRFCLGRCGIRSSE